MPVAIFKEPIEVDNRLDARFHLSREQFLDIIGAMISARRDCTDNDPAGSVGWSSYQIGTRRVREITKIEGYVRDSTDQIESAANKDLGIKIVVANTDAGTGLEEYSPQNNSRKGAATDRVITSNQWSFIDGLDASMPVVSIKRATTLKADYVTWYLCVYHDGDEIRAEISLPSQVENGFFSDFVERIIIVGREGFDGTSIRRDTNEGGAELSEYDIQVSRK